MTDSRQRPGGRPRRADARRNYELLVEQARITFTASGVDASLDEIARNAGVASGTLYRHFPTRLDLVEAVLAEPITALADLGRDLLNAPDALDALTTWLRASIGHALTYRGLAAAVMNSALDDKVSSWHAELFDVAGRLLERARHARVIVADANDTDVLKMVGAIAWAVADANDSATQADRLLNLLMNGLRRDWPDGGQEGAA